MKGFLLMQEQLINHLTDDSDNFYFMINPYFPTPGMMDQIRSNLDHLIRYYPSGLQAIVKKIRHIEGIKRPMIAANGSCEAIRIMLRRYRGKTLVLVPNFNEWEISEHVPIDYNASTQRIAQAIKTHKIDLVCICNPNNPTGFYRRDIQELADAFPKVRFAVDISFIDFVDETIPERPKGKNVILVKSLGKNYGICGIRLGYIASEDQAFLDTLYPEFPIWNINSITEYLLDLIAENKDAYEKSRIQIIQGTRKMRDLLEEFPFIEVFPGHANFIMIRTRAKLGFNLKSCANKTGLDNTYYRIAYNKNYDILRKLLSPGSQGVTND